MMEWYWWTLIGVTVATIYKPLVYIVKDMYGE